MSMIREDEILLGGQAVIEGVMMRSSDLLAVAVRKQDGEISIRKEDFVSFLKRYPVLKIPILRGAVILLQSLIIGIRSLNYSAEVALAEEQKKIGKEPSEGSGISAFALGASVVFALVFGLALFFFLPLFLTELLKKASSLLENSILFNLVDGVIRIIIFVIYIFSISLIKDIRKIFQYHGAEHKTVYAYEAGDELTVENVKKFSILHPRCGTSFLLFVMVVAILLFSFLPADQPLYVKIWPRLALLPLIAGISYEVIRQSAKRRENRFFQALIWPGLFFQRMTTAEPSDEQLAVAIEALKNVLPSSNRAEIVPS